METGILGRTTERIYSVPLSVTVSSDQARKQREIKKEKEKKNS